MKRRGETQARAKRRGAWFARRVRHRRGVASIEAAFAISALFVPLCLAIIGLGMALVVANRLDCALQAAMFYGWANPGSPSAWGSVGSTSVAAARSAALAAYGNAAPSPTITVSVAFDCVSSGYVETQTATGYTCPVGQAVATYLTMTGTASVAPPGLWLGPALALSVTGTARVQ